jgi:hypothetical protein
MLLRAGAHEKAADYEGATPRDASKMGPSTRVCLGLLKEAERVNLLLKLRVAMLAQENQERGRGRGIHATSREVEEEGKQESEQEFEQDTLPPLSHHRASGKPWPLAELRPVPSARTCWWIPGGRGSRGDDKDNKKKSGRKQKSKMAVVPREVRAAVLEHVVRGGEGGLSDDVFLELRKMML